MSSKVLKNCKKTILNLLKSLCYDDLPFVFEDLFSDGVETIVVWYNKHFPYVYKDILTKTTVNLLNKSQIIIYQHATDFEKIELSIQFHYQNEQFTVVDSQISENSKNQFCRMIKQTYAQHDFWNEVEL